MRDSARKEERHTTLMRIAACAAVLVATIVAAQTPKNADKGRTKASAWQLEEQDARIAAIDQVRLEAMSRAQQEYGSGKQP